MQTFTIAPNQSLAKAANFTHQDGSASSLSAPVTYSVDHPELLKTTPGNVNGNPNGLTMQPVLPAAASGGTVTITGSFVNENGVTVNQQFQIVIQPNPNPTTGFLMA